MPKKSLPSPLINKRALRRHLELWKEQGGIKVRMGGDLAQQIDKDVAARLDSIIREIRPTTLTGAVWRAYKN